MIAIRRLFLIGGILGLGAFSTYAQETEDIPFAMIEKQPC